VGIELETNVRLKPDLLLASDRATNNGNARRHVCGASIPEG
jgi:hypothetical protein